MLSIDREDFDKFRLEAKGPFCVKLVSGDMVYPITYYNDLDDHVQYSLAMEALRDS